MYLRRCYRQKDGKRHGYWALVESYRTARGPRQRVVAYLGELDEQGRLGVQRAAQPDPAPQADLFDRESSREWVEVDLNGVRVERSRPFGGGWLGLMLLRQLGLGELLEALMPSGREEVPWSAMTVVLVLGRLLDPSSELHLAEHGYEASALAELLGVPAAKVNDDRLYRALDRLLPHKPALEKHLKQRLGELFELDYDLLLYDVTSTYFEGLAAANPQAQGGYSRDHRPDCKQVNIALVVSRSGLPLGYEVFAGNRSDVTTVKEIVEAMESKYGQANRIWVMDRGMVSADNVEFLQQGGRIVAIGPSSINLAQQLGLPVSNHLVERTPTGTAGSPLPAEKYYVPGSLLEVTYDTTLDATRGQDSHGIVFFDNSPVMRLGPDAESKGVKPIAWFENGTPLRSGWAWGQNYLDGGVAMAEAKYGQGTVYLFGPEITFRAQPAATFKLLFNAIVGGSKVDNRIVP